MPWGIRMAVKCKNCGSLRTDFRPRAGCKDDGQLRCIECGKSYRYQRNRKRVIAADDAWATRHRKAIADAVHWTAKWAITMTKWRITFETQRGGVRARRWHVVTFTGPHGSESRGVVDLLAIRKDHRSVRGIINRGDLFEMVLIQVKGGSSGKPSEQDIKRLCLVAKQYRAKDVVLSEWKPRKSIKFKRLKHSLFQGERCPRIDRAAAWEPLSDIAEVFW